MNIEKVVVGNLRCNCYILDINEKVLVIDPGDEFNKIDNVINNREVVGVIITHYHFDHIGCLNNIINKYKCNIYDINNMNEGLNNIDCFNFYIIYTPGHKEDEITIYFKKEKIMFCGDFIFKDSIGRWDLEGGNVKSMFNSINRIKKYDRDIVLYPGHGENTTLGYEIDNNIYFNSNLI